jgi:CRP-like cAMP-binding protein
MAMVSDTRNLRATRIVRPAHGAAVARLADAELEVPAGPWTPPPRRALGAGVFSLLLADGVLLREVHLGDMPALQLLGHGDVVSPWENHESSVLAGARVSWVALKDTRLSVLGTRFLEGVGRAPRVALALHQQMLAQLDRLARLAAIAQLPRVEDRVLALFCALGDDHGHVAPDGIVIDLRLTHATIGRLVGARRPTVTLALKRLAESRLLARRGHGWVLSVEATALAARSHA